MAKQSALVAAQLPAFETAHQSAQQPEWPANDATIVSAHETAFVATIQTAEQTAQSPAFLSADSTDISTLESALCDPIGAAQQPTQWPHGQPDHVYTDSSPQCVPHC